MIRTAEMCTPGCIGTNLSCTDLPQGGSLVIKVESQIVRSLNTDKRACMLSIAYVSPTSSALLRSLSLSLVCRVLAACGRRNVMFACLTSPRAAGRCQHLRRWSIEDGSQSIRWQHMRLTAAEWPRSISNDVRYRSILASVPTWSICATIGVASVCFRPALDHYSDGLTKNLQSSHTDDAQSINRRPDGVWGCVVQLSQLSQQNAYKSAEIFFQPIIAPVAQFYSTSTPETLWRTMPVFCRQVVNFCVVYHRRYRLRLCTRRQM